MTPEQLLKAKALYDRLKSLRDEIDSFGTEIDPNEAKHQIWQVWLPLCTAEANLDQIIRLES